jgi:hypothetical protein
VTVRNTSRSKHMKMCLDLRLEVQARDNLLTGAVGRNGQMLDECRGWVACLHVRRARKGTLGSSR